MDGACSTNIFVNTTLRCIKEYECVFMVIQHLFIFCSFITIDAVVQIVAFSFVCFWYSSDVVLEGTDMFCLFAGRLELC